MLYLDALNIATGGGLILLDYLERELVSRGIPYQIFVRKASLALNAERAVVGTPTILGRYRLYKRQVDDTDPDNVVLCFGNFPPPFPLRCRTVTYFHRPALAGMNTERATLVQRFKYNLKKRYLRSLLFHTDTFVFQSRNIRNAFVLTYPSVKAELQLLPFFEMGVYEPLAARAATTDKEDRFIYVSNDAPHKNHGMLLNAWEKMLGQDLRPHLVLTLPESSLFLARVEELCERGARITNLGIISHKQVLEETLRSRFAIFPSLAETLGLGIVEALYSKCQVLAADLPYTYEVINPILTFAPSDVDAIITTVRQALTEATLPLPTIAMENGIDEFISLLTQRPEGTSVTTSAFNPPHSSSPKI